MSSSPAPTAHLPPLRRAPRPSERQFEESDFDQRSISSRTPVTLGTIWQVFHGIIWHGERDKICRALTRSDFRLVSECRESFSVSFGAGQFDVRV